MLSAKERAGDFELAVRLLLARTNVLLNHRPDDLIEMANGTRSDLADLISSAKGILEDAVNSQELQSYKLTSRGIPMSGKYNAEQADFVADACRIAAERILVMAAIARRAANDIAARDAGDSTHQILHDALNVSCRVLLPAKHGVL